ncbi:MAG: hypothetical protein EVA83_02945 [Hyphomicrobiales bacterium]|nr:hypothetical protein [Rhodobiaceae bacterium]OUT83492.1 MAG: hypothetical protein CBB88_01605 [Rhizobiales bacterium TMED28]RZO33519.1 MAG: hypothetical protein EVA83_02945 [Hyphomicrobiales bacterium]
MSESGMPQLNTEYFASQIFWLVISFIILYVVMSKYALPKIANVIETREDIIARDVEDAENFKKESEITEQGYLQSIKEAQENASNYLSNSRNKLNIFIEEENSVFENESRDLINKFEIELEKKKAAVLANSEKIAHDVSNDILSTVFGENPLVTDTLADNIKILVKK